MRSAASSFAPAARHALLGAYRTGFSSTLNHLMVIAAIIALVGAIAGIVLVREKDFVPSGEPAPGAPAGTEPVFAVAALSTEMVVAKSPRRAR